MNNGKLVVWGMGVGVLGMSVFVGCAPTITVSRDDAGAAGVEDPGGHLGGGSGTSTGGSGGSGANGPGAGGGEIVAGRAGTGSVAGRGGSEPGPGVGGTATGGNGGSAGSVVVIEPPDGCPCSRRPTFPESPDCPRGTGAVEQNWIMPEGNDVELRGTPSTVGVPFRVRMAPGSKSNKIILRETTLSPPVGLFDVSPVYRVEPDDTDIAEGSEVSVPWTVPSGSVPRGIAIYYAAAPEGPWERMADSYTNAGFEQATMTRPGYFVAAYPRTEELEACPAGPVLDFSTVNCGSTDPAELLTTTCSKSFCHGRQFVTLDLRTDPGLASRLLDQPATFGDIPCPDDVTQTCIPDTCPGNALLVDSANPDASWMLTKVQPDPLVGGIDGCGDLMPPSSGVSTADYACYRAIIAAIAALPK